MSIIAAELVWRRPAEVSDAGTNGGRMTATAITSATKNNVFPDVPQAERTAGSTKYRKVFIHVANDADLSFVAPKVFVETRTPGDDNVTFIAGTQRNTQSAITGSEQKYGSGILNGNVSAGASSMSVLTEDSALGIFANGMKVRISDKASIGGSGNEEYVTLTGAASYVGNVATFSFTPVLANGYSATVTKVASVYEPGDVACVVANWTETGAGTYNEGTYPVECDSIATIEQDWTLTFNSATGFTVTGDTLGSVGAGNVSSDFAPVNADFSKPYFTLRSAGFGGTWATGNTITFRTSPASIPLWYRRQVPAGAASLSGNSVIVAVDGESA
jgi:hypothetical protein